MKNKYIMVLSLGLFISFPIMGMDFSEASARYHKHRSQYQNLNNVIIDHYPFLEYVSRNRDRYIDYNKLVDSLRASAFDDLNSFQNIWLASTKTQEFRQFLAKELTPSERDSYEGFYKNYVEGELKKIDKLTGNYSPEEETPAESAAAGDAKAKAEEAARAAKAEEAARAAEAASAAFEELGRAAKAAQAAKTAEKSQKLPITPSEFVKYYAGKPAHEILNINEDASEDEIKSAFRKVSLNYHPNSGRLSLAKDEEKKVGNEAFIMITNAKVDMLSRLGIRS